MSVVPLEPELLAQQLVSLGIECKRDPMAVTRVHNALDNIGVPNEQYALSRALKELAGRPVEGQDEDEEEEQDQPKKQPGQPVDPSRNPGKGTPERPDSPNPQRKAEQEA